MNRRTKFNFKSKHLLIVALILLIALVIVSFISPNKVSPVKSAIGNVISPMQRGINSVGKSVFDRWEKLQNISDLMEENELLREQVNTLSYENKLLLQDKYELDRLRDLFELDEKYAQYPKVAARVIAADPNNWFTVFTIDKGTDDGISVDMNVMAGNGLVGIVEEVGTKWAKVRTIIDDQSNVSGMFLKTSDTCIVEGDLELMEQGVIRVEEINRDAKVEEGYEVVTSHISDKYLQGILIGYVKEITLDPNNLTKSAYLVPVVNFEHLEEVLIITELKEKIDKPVEE
ncbi:MAG: rod shape-determining protein MreC [Clostridiales bacterium]|nr:rod shape-determining protein MreC [Clostridiales bacterium]